jgi:lipoprotein
MYKKIATKEQYILSMSVIKLELAQIFGKNIFTYLCIKFYYIVNFWIYKDYTIRLKGEKRKNGKITKRTRYYRITSDGRFEEIKGKVSK